MCPLFISVVISVVLYYVLTFRFILILFIHLLGVRVFLYVRMFVSSSLLLYVFSLFVLFVSFCVCYFLCVHVCRSLVEPYGLCLCVLVFRFVCVLSVFLSVCFVYVFFQNYVCLCLFVMSFLVFLLFCISLLFIYVSVLLYVLCWLACVWHCVLYLYCFFCLSVYLSVSLSMCLYFRLSFCLSLLCLCVSVSVCLVRLCVCSFLC